MRCFCTKIRTHHCKVVLLDEQELIQEIQDTSRGQEVLDTVYRHLNLLETSYFGLRYIDTSNQTHWLDTTKKVVKQLKGKETFTLYFGVKFYAADPCKLLEEITRYQFFLQVKQDILQGRLPVPFDLAAELGAYVVQSELGDYDPRRHSPGYVSEFRFLSNQSVELEGKIAEQHKDMQGQLPSVAELNYLDKVKWLEMYGVDLHPVLGEDNVEYFLGLTPTGVIVLRNKNKVANYFWPRITKIYFKGRYFMLRVCDKNNEENTYGFETPSKPACKHLYKCCVEHHAFFRLVQVSPNPPDVIGTRFSSGRAEKISQREAQMRLRSPPQFTRTPSRRYQRRIVEGAQDIPKVDEMPKANKENIPIHEVKHISVPQPVQSVSSLYRGTAIIPSRCDSPRSTRSAPWGVGVGAPLAPPSRGLYSGSSPRSVRSSGPHAGRGTSHHAKARRSSSVESHSSNDSRSCRRHRHRSRRGSDNESELSRCSGKSRRHRHRSRRSSGSEHESRRHSTSKHRYELVESESQWKEVQRKQAEGGTGVHQATVISSGGQGGGGGGRPRSGYMNSGMETESEHSYHHRRKHRKHRSRSRSPSDKPRLPDELKQHLEFQLVETEGMSESQLREIPYKVVETSQTAKAVKLRLSPTNKRRTHSARRVKGGTLKEEELPSTGDSPPPPYSESPATNQNAPSTNDVTDLTNKNAANNNSSSHQLPRNGTPALNQQSSESSTNNTRSLCSALYGNPTTLLGSATHHNINRRNQSSLDNSNWISQDQSKVASYHNSQHGNSMAGGHWKQDLPPRNIPFGSMRQSLSNSSNHKSWIGPEVRGTVGGLSWQPHAKTPDNHFPQNYGALPETLLSRRPSQEGLLNYSSKPPRPNMNASSQEYLATSNGGLNYAGVSSNLRSSRSSIIDQANGNLSYNSPSHRQMLPSGSFVDLKPTFTQSSSFVDLNRTTTPNGDSFHVRQVNGGDVNSKPRITSSSSSSLQSTSNLTNTSKSRSNLSVDQNGLVTPTSLKGVDHVTNSQSQQQLMASTDELNNVTSANGVKWAADLGQQDQANKNWAPVFYQQNNKAVADQQNTNSTSTPKSEVNNNPMIVHEMSTEL